MRKTTVTMCIAWLLLVGQPGALFADYVMMCTFFYNPVARVYKVSDEGDITLVYPLEVGGNPESLCFAPNGRWGLIGSHTTTYPPTQKTIVIGVNENRQISVLGTAHCEHERLVAISPDSQYGFYGNILQTLRFYPNGNFAVIPTDNSYMCYQADSSNLSRNLIGQGWNKVEEFTLLPDGRTTSTGVILDISPSDGYQDLQVSPDGRTCIVLSIGKYEITVLRIYKSGGFSLVQQFRSTSRACWEVDFTPDSKFAIVSFPDSVLDKANLISYSIGSDSLLTEVDSIDLPNFPGGNMAITPDGKFAITVALIQDNSYFYVVRIHENGTFEYLPDKDYICTGHVSDVAFVPPRKTAASTSWTMY